MILDVFNESFSRIEHISIYSYAEYTKFLNQQGEFEVHISLDDTARTIMSEGVFILLEKNVCGIITLLEPTSDEETGEKKLTIKGHLTNSLLDRRCIPAITNLSGTVTNVVRGLVNSHAVSPTDTKRSLPIILSTNPDYIPSSPNITKQVTGGTLKEAVEELLETQEMGYDVAPILSQTAITGFEFRVIAGKDKTITNTSSNDPVVFSVDLRNILTSEYNYNTTDYKNMAYVAGEGEGSERVVVTTGETTAQGLDRYELYVDARDIQSVDENNEPISTSDYENLLIARGTAKLKENIIEETYAATVNEENAQYIYGEHYNLGDLVTIRDSSIGVTLDARVTQIQAVSEGERSILNVTFGYYKMSTKQKLRRNGVI